MNSTFKIALVPIFAAAIAVSGFGAALASEVGGTVGSGGGQSQEESYADGALVASVSGDGPAENGPSAASENASVSGGGGRSSSARLNRGMTASGGSESAVMIIDDAALASVETAGTGGGYDPALEAFLSDEAADEIGYLSPAEAIAFNSSQNIDPSDLSASAAETGLGSGRIWMAVVLGLSLVGLAGYAVNALMSYRRENDL
ncbi:MAG: hypothetical protein HZA81_02130 [Candidatus Taylorbacteria bacterium]|nr:hypothetical protein [Candidatus Taylorbacteria bacterium]